MKIKPAVLSRIIMLFTFFPALLMLAFFSGNITLAMLGFLLAGFLYIINGLILIRYKHGYAWERFSFREMTDNIAYKRGWIEIITGIIFILISMAMAYSLS